MTRLAAIARHPLAITGAVIATASGVGFVILAIALVAGLFDHPYAGLVVGILLPALLVIGLLLIPAAMWLERRRAATRSEPSPDWPVFDFRVPSVRRAALMVAALTTANIVIVLLAGYSSLHWMESPSFCGAVCHTPMQPQFVAWQAGSHGTTACVRCHIGEGPAAFVHAKLAGIRQLTHVIVGSYSRPTPPGTDMPPGAQANTCASCHSPESVRGDRIRVIREYGDDEANTESTTTLQMRIGAIHWHADPANRVEYVATDSSRETIAYVKVIRADGQAREYQTPDATEQMIRAGTRRVMDCVDCHNTVGHPIAATAEQAVDRAIAAGRISRQLPHARREAVRLMKMSFASEPEAAAAIDREFREFYRSRPGAVDDAALGRGVAALQTLYRSNVFPAMKVTWGSYPDNRGHVTATGCFRCHGGSHADKSGSAINADCEFCHTQVVAPE